MSIQQALAIADSVRDGARDISPQEMIEALDRLRESHYGYQLAESTLFGAMIDGEVI